MTEIHDEHLKKLTVARLVKIFLTLHLNILLHQCIVYIMRRTDPLLGRDLETNE
jgi:hypothetical protein